MRYSVLVYGRPFGDLLELATNADRLGFAGVWLGEHLVHPANENSEHPPGGSAPREIQSTRAVENPALLDPFIALGAVAQATARLDVATGMALLAVRHPLVSARAAITMNELSSGRFILGVGSGWMREEFDAVGVDFSSRVGRIEESIEIIRLACAGGRFSFHGRYYSFEDLDITPIPVDVPIVLGGNAAPALRRAARYGDGWFISGSRWTPEELFAYRDEIERHRTAFGRSGPFRIYGRYEFADHGDLEQFRKEGIEDLLLRADQVWPAEATSQQKRARLAEVAAELEIETH